MKRAIIISLITTLFFFFLFEYVLSTTGRIYGRIYTDDDKIYEGWIRWDKNEAFWDDILDATKKYDTPHPRKTKKERYIKIFGFRISLGEEGEEGETSASMGIKFGHLEQIKVRSGHRATLYLKNGTKMDVTSYGTDIGNSVRGIEVEGPEFGKLTLDWDNLEKVHFEKEPDRTPAKKREGLYGKLTTRDGEEFTGFITWDTDELFSTDILDGEEHGRDWEIPFGNIEAIERRSRSSARVYLTNGEKLTLSGTNDVNSSVRGIQVNDSEIGLIDISWGSFDRVDFLKGGEKYLKSYDEFDGGERLYGTVEDEDGEKYTGYITWDDDEKFGWEILNGKYHDLDMEIEFCNIQSIRKRAFWGAEVTLKNGKQFRLEDSNDVNEDNKGIFIEDDEGNEIRIDWDDFEKVRFFEK
ncbi:MAG: hypothetical protein WBD28_11735 [Candidatus Zixiibacteriota bacterium]